MSLLFVFAFISLLIAGMQLTWFQVDTEVDMKENERQKRKKNKKDLETDSST